MQTIRQFSVSHALFLIFGACTLLALVVQLRHVGLVVFCFAAGVGMGAMTRNLRLAVSSLTALLVFVATYLACWLQMGYVHQMGSPHPYIVRNRLLDIQDGLMKYQEANGTFPDSLAELNKFEVAHLETSPSSDLDWWNHPFHYRKTSAGFELGSLGRDGTIGGTGLDADILISDVSQTVSTLGLPLHQFVLETAGSRIVFWCACIGSIIAGGIWFIASPMGPPTGEPRKVTSLVVRLVATTISAVVVAAFLAAFHVAASQSGH